MQLRKLLAQSLFWRGWYFVSLLLVNIFLSRYLQAGWIGWLYYSCNIFSLMVLLCSLNLDTGIAYFAAGRQISSQKMSWLSLGWTMLVGVLVWCSLRFFPAMLPVPPGLTASVMLAYALGYICGIVLINTGTGLFYASGNFRLPNFLLIAINLVLILLIPKHSAGTGIAEIHQMLTIYFGSFLVAGILLVGVFILTSGSWKKLQFPTAAENRKIFRYSLIALMANVVFFLVYRIDYWFVGYYCSPRQLGNYVQVSKMGQMLLIVPQIMASAVFPKTASGADQPVTRDTVLIISRLLTGCYILLMLVSVLTGYWLFPFIFGKSFDGMYTPFLALLPGIWSLSVLALLAAYFSGNGNVRINVTGGLVSVVVMITGNFIFLPRGGGILAAATISTLSYFLYMFYLVRRFRVDYQVKLRDFLYLRKEDLLWMAGFLKFKKTDG